MLEKSSEANQVVETHRHESRHAPATPREVVVIYGFLGGQAIVFLYALYLFITTLVSLVVPQVKAPMLPVYWNVFAVTYAFTIYGISMWNHRMATHGAYKAPKWFKYIIASWGAMAAQGFFRNWLGDHHEHHAHTEVPCTGKPDNQPCDPHTPKDGFWHSFWGWLVKAGARDEHPHWKNAETIVASLENQLARPGLDEARKQKIEQKIRDAKDRIENRNISRFFDSTLGLWVAASIIVPGLICAAFVGTWQSFLLGCVISGFGRMGAVNIATSLVNSYEHIPSFPGNYRHFEWTNDDSNNNWFIALFNPEGFHWWHHVFPWAANHGIFWWERLLDHTANFIWVLEKIGLVWDVRWVTVKDALELKAKIENRTTASGHS